MTLPDASEDVLDWLEIEEREEALKLVLPLPPSMNSYWRSIVLKGAVRVLVSKEGRAFKEHCALLARAQRAPKIEGDIAVRGVVYFENRRRDLDNAMKPLFDALAGVCYDNDRQIRHIDLKAEIDAGNPRVEIELEAA